jgi:TatD DNase family protein
MSPSLIDTHCHLDIADFDNDREQVIERALAAGISHMITIGASDGLRSAERAIQLAEKYPQIYASVGVHPHDADKNDLDFELLKTLAAHDKVVGIGESGLDYFKNWSSRSNQELWFKKQIELAIEINKPLIIHSRDAGEDCLSILKEYRSKSNLFKQLRGVFHCYSEDQNFAKELIKIDFFVSFPGTLTFKKCDNLRDTAKAIALERILLETDAPFMAPEPFRGKRCESAFMVETAKVLATIKGVTLEHIAEVTSNNASKLFSLN